MAEIVIPEKYMIAAREIVEACKKCGARAAFATIVPGIRTGEWRDDVVVQWSEGRHGEDKNKIEVSARINLQVKIDAVRIDCHKCGGKNTYFVREKMCSTCDTGNS